MVRTVILSTVFLACAAAALEVTIISFEEGELNFAVKGSGTAVVKAQIDYKYLSDLTGDYAYARATSDSLKVKLTGQDTPVKITFAPPPGVLEEAEVIVYVNDVEKGRQTYYY